jgi:hypothetical protein
MTAQFAVTTGLTALTAATAKTLIEINPDASTPAELIALTVSSSYLTTATPLALVVELGTATGTGTGTAATVKRAGQAVGTQRSTVKVNDTVEPAGFSAVHVWDLVLPGDRLDYIWPLGREYFLGVSTFNAIRLTAPVGTPSIRATAWFEE